MEHHSEIKSESPCEKEYIKSESSYEKEYIKSERPCKKEYKKYCLNGGECYYLVDEENVACNCTWMYGEKRCEKHMWWT